MKKRLLLKKEYNIDIWNMTIEKAREYDKFNSEIVKELVTTSTNKDLIEI